MKKKKNEKEEKLLGVTVDATDKGLTTNQGLLIEEDEFSLKSSDRGPTLLEDFHLREKITHFDHERIPERIVHARGTGAHGVFTLYESMGKYTKAKFLNDTSKETPIFMRISTVQGSRGSADSVRDVRGFAIKFYTEEGNYDIVGNNFPIFSIQDAIKFPDFIHAVKPEPHNEMPQGGSAHDTFWDFVANNPETSHITMWSMSQRAIPRSLRMIEGFAIHTFSWINDKGERFFIKYHFKPILGVHSMVWDEAQKTNGKDPDFHRRDLMENIEKGNFPEWEVGVQILKEEDEFSLDFDILDPTKLWPEEDVPVKIFGKITLNRNVENFFAETEQVAFHPGHIVPGIDFTNDPLLQGRLFSYTDTQISRLGGPNFHQIPINQPLNEVYNNQRDAMHQMKIHKGQTSYHKNSLNGNSPHTTSREEGGFNSYEEKVEGRKVRARSESFKDFYSQAKMFYNSITGPEKDSLTDAFIFELQMVKSLDIRQQVTDLLCNISHKLAKDVAKEIGTKFNSSIKEVEYNKTSNALSMESTPKMLDTMKVGIWLTEGYDYNMVSKVKKSLEDSKVAVEIISDKLGEIPGDNGKALEAKKTHLTAASCLFESGLFFGPDEKASKAYIESRNEFSKDTFKHFKPMGTVDKNLIDSSINEKEEGIYIAKEFDVEEFKNILIKQRFYKRNVK